jgi:hypothetical protein
MGLRSVAMTCCVQNARERRSSVTSNRIGSLVEPRFRK